MGVAELLQPVLADGIRAPYFFNGRILTAEDLRAMRDATVAREGRLGRALGDGVAHGLDVQLVDGSAAERPILHVGAGLAFNRRGEALELPADVDLALVRAADAAAGPAGGFVPCPPPQPQTTLTNLGLYVLTILPASGYAGRVAMTELTNEGVGTACGSRYEVSGVEFRLVRLEVGTDAETLALRGSLTALDAQLATLASRPTATLERDVRRRISRLRNAVAYLAFGLGDHAAFVTDPFAGGTPELPLAGHALLDRLRAGSVLADGEVPLAVVYWTRTGVRFVDTWAVRRSLVPTPPSGRWASLAGTRQAAERLAMVLQFQRHLADLAGEIGAEQALLAARDYFDRLPPVGLLPAVGGSTTIGFDPLRFFDGRTVRQPTYVEGAGVDALLRQALAYPPIDLGDRELTWLYLVRENVQAGAPRYVIFANGQMPFAAHPRFDLNYWDFAHYAGPPLKE